MIPYLYDALKSIRPTAQWSITGDDEYENIVWLDENTTKPSFDEVISASTKVQEAKNLELYKQKRFVDYPKIQEQLDMLYWDKINGTTVWQDTISAIKQKYPKP
jgi:hypothetical protein